MKKLCFFLLTVCLMGVVACKNNEPKDKQMIASNLLRKGSLDVNLIVGEWNCIKFAYTTDGNKISSVANISNCVVNIGDASFCGTTDDELPSHNLSVYFKICCFPYLQSSNIINFIQDKSACFAILEPYTDDEIEVDKALRNAYSFIIRGDELIIHFIGVKNKNLLILKKNEL